MITPSDSEASFILVDEPQKNENRASHEVKTSNLVTEAVKEAIGGSLKTDATFHPSLSASYIPGSMNSYAHDWSPAGTGGGLKLNGRHIVDQFGRVCNLRGVNLSGSCKIPTNHDHETFPLDHEHVTFVGRPFPLSEAHEHFSRLRRWGLTFFRFLVTWEAVEHEGPGVYDNDYLDYLRDLLSLLPKYGLTVFIVIHQDVWSRYSGGSGAPAWTLEEVGFDLHALEESGAAWLLGVKGGGHVEAERGIWPCGYQKLAAATMATCFWGGDAFAPKLKIKTRGGQAISVQQFLQDAFLDMYTVLAEKVGNLEGVIGFEIMNEPHRGYIDLPSLHAFDYNTDLHLSHVPSPLQSFMLGSGYPTAVSHWTRSFPLPTRRTSESVLNSASRKAWRTDGPTEGKCIWEMHGVWGWDNNKNEGVVLRQNYFVKHPMTGKKVDWYTDFYFPFLKRWEARLRQVIPSHKMLFVEPIPNELCPSSWTPEWRPSNLVFAPHWYDLHALFNKAFGDFNVNVQGLSRGMFLLRALYWGQQGARDNYSLQIRNIVEQGYRALGETPIIIGECGIPMDMNNKEAFTTENWTMQMRMMDAMITALERNLVGFTLWNYNPDNDDQFGDHWNGENFSFFSRRRALPASLLDYEQTAPTLDNGARILPAIVRPYVAKTAGVPKRFEYEINEGVVEVEWVVWGGGGAGKDVQLGSRETEIFLPELMLQGRKLVVEGLNGDAGDRYRYDTTRQTLFIVQGRGGSPSVQSSASTSTLPSPAYTYKLRIYVDPPPRRAFLVNSFWTDFGDFVGAGLVVLVAVLALWLSMRFYG